MPPRSYHEAQAERALEVFEIDSERVRDALATVADLFSRPGGETYAPLYERLKWEWDAMEERRAHIERARAEAAETAKVLSRPKRRAVRRG